MVLAFKGKAYKKERQSRNERKNIFRAAESRI